MDINNLSIDDLIKLNVNDLIANYKKVAEAKSKEQIERFVKSVVNFYVSNFSINEKKEFVNNPLLYLGIDHDDKLVGFSIKGHRKNITDLELQSNIVNTLKNFSEDERFNELTDELISKGVKIERISNVNSFLMYPSDHGDANVISNIIENMIEKYDASRAEEDMRKKIVNKAGAAVDTNN